MWQSFKCVNIVLEVCQSNEAYAHIPNYRDYYKNNHNQAPLSHNLQFFDTKHQSTLYSYILLKR